MSISDRKGAINILNIIRTQYHCEKKTNYVRLIDIAIGDVKEKMKEINNCETKMDRRRK